MAGLPCPKCGHMKSYVVDTREFVGGIRRRRECEECEYRFTTYECESGLMRRLHNRAFKRGYEDGGKKAKHE